MLATQDLGMSLAAFSIIVAIDAGNGIAKDGNIPWSSKEDMKFFRDTTLGKGRNAVIMGRLTYESIPEENRPLQGRKCVVISRTWKQEDHSDIMVYSSLVDALAGIGSAIKGYDEVYIAGGEHIYKEAIEHFGYLCKKIHVTKFKNDYVCDQFFPFDSIKDFPLACDPAKTRDYTRYTFTPKITHDEYQYLDIMRLAKDGDSKPDRTGVGTRSIFAPKSMVFDLTTSLPILTTKRVFYETIIKELLFFISGKTDTKLLSEQGVKIWEGNTKKEVLVGMGLPWNDGDGGPGFYGFLWRHWGAEYKGCEGDYTGQGVDQLQNLITGIRNDPHSRRHIITAWDPSRIALTPLPACHCMAQFYVSADRKYLDCQLYQRSGDLFLGVPFNITSYALFTYMIAHVTGLKARRFTHVLGDAHIYNNHGEQVNRLLQRMPRPFPKLTFRNSTRIHEIDDFTFDSFIIEGYTSWPAITAEMAV